MSGPNTWYVRRKGEVNGPYPAGLVSRYILLGRVKESDQVSSDGNEWHLVSDVPQLIPKILKGDTSDPLFQERLQAARRWADERDRSRRESGGKGNDDERRQGGDRRGLEAEGVRGHRLARRAREKEVLTEAQNRWAVLFIAGVACFVSGLFINFYTPAPQVAEIDCHSPAAPKINWNNCVMDGARLDEKNLSSASLYSVSFTGASLRRSTLTGANLSYANLSISHLEGADLRNATLVGANLRYARLDHALLDSANLSYADLTGAKISGVSLQNAKLGNAIWIDGRRCLPDSVGSCHTAP